MEYVRDKIHELYYDYDFNCARTMLTLLSDIYQVEIETQTYHATVGMHGAGGFGAQCGLVEGGLLFLGIYLEGKISNKEIVTCCYDFAQQFSETFGSLTCSDLRPNGFNDNDSPHLCEGITGEAIEFTISYIDGLNIKVMTGGNVNRVVRIGTTIRRQSLHNNYSQQLLLFLESTKFNHVPKYLGQDDLGREILSFLDGEVPGNQYPKAPFYIWSDEVLEATARLLKNYHDASVGFSNEEPSHMAYPNKTLHEVICHNDFALYNIVFKEQVPIGIIDFDMAGPGPRLWDIAYTLYTSVPLTSFQPDFEQGKIVDYDFYYDENRKKRIHLFFEAYGLPVPSDLKYWVIRRVEKLCDTIMEKARSGDEAFIKMVEEGHLEHYECEVEFLKKHFPSV